VTSSEVDQAGKIIQEQGVRVPMRDGVALSADVWRPDTGEQVPALICRTPYGKQMTAMMAAPEQLAGGGFAVIVQDCRGRFESEGVWTYVHAEIDDGYDTVEWAAAQPWCNGRVGVFGASYMGNTQWLAAEGRPPHLEAMAPECCSADYWAASFGPGGALRLALRIGWTASVIASMAPQWGISDALLDQVRESGLAVRNATVSGDAGAVRAAKEQAQKALEDVYRIRPIRDNPLWHGRATWLDEIFEHESQDDANWRRINPATYYDVLDLPAVHVGGWYDIHLDGIIGNYTGMRRQAPTARARDAQRMIIGPWSHWSPFSPVVGSVDFGPAAVLDVTAMRQDWFRAWLQDGPQPDWAPVRLFVMGENAWRDEQEWPLARTRYTSWYLQPGGGLGPQEPAAGTAADGFTFDPADPAPTIGGRLLGVGEFAGPYDQRPAGERADVLAYTSEPLAEPTELTGPVQVELWASTDAEDTDFTAVLIDVLPDGTALNLCEGAVRARQTDLPAPLVAGAVYPFTIDLVATSIVLPAGHRLRLHVSSSSFPMWEPNPGTGAALGTDTDADLRTARQSVYHDAQHPSRVILPVIPR
jgi:putative CocE/NonD family hydrolase